MLKHYDFITNDIFKHCFTQETEELCYKFILKMTPKYTSDNSRKSFFLVKYSTHRYGNAWLYLT